MTHCVSFTLIGGPTVLFEYAGLRFLTDPTFDPPGPNGNLTKLAGPAIAADSIGDVDVVLLSHDEHEDNLDTAGRASLRDVDLVLTTPGGGERVPGALGMSRWQSKQLVGADADGAKIEVTATAVAARHGTSAVKHLAGQVTGFVLEAHGWPTVYISGDNASVGKARQVAKRFPHVDIAVLFAGAAKAASIGDVLLTLNAERTSQVAALWPKAAVVPVHIDDWAHFTQPRADLLRELAGAGYSDGDLAARVVMLERGLPREIATSTYAGEVRE